MTFDQPAAGGHHPGRLDRRHLGQSARRFLGDQGPVGTGCPGDVAQMFDRVHGDFSSRA